MSTNVAFIKSVPVNPASLLPNVSVESSILLRIVFFRTKVRFYQRLSRESKISNDDTQHAFISQPPECISCLTRCLSIVLDPNCTDGGD